MMVSTIITTYGGGKQLQRAIDSVLNQTYQDLEVIVVDDNNPDTDSRRQTEKTMQKYSLESRVKYLKHDKNKNGAVARNTGLKISSGKYISFLDDDDYYLPNRFESILKKLETAYGLVGVYTGVNIQDENNVTVMTIRPKQNLTIKELLLNEMAIGTGSNIFIRSEVAKKINGFDENFVRRQDIEFMIRVCEYGTVGYLSETLVIKSVNDIANHPKYEKMKLVLEQFIQKFEKHIALLDNRMNDFYCVQYRTLLNIAFYEREKNEIKEAIDLINKYGKVTAKEYTLAFIYIHNLRNNDLINWLINVRKSIRSKIYKSRERKGQTMNIGYLSSAYPEVRCIINKTDSTYVLLNRRADFYFLKNRINKKPFGSDWDVQYAYRPIAKRFRNIDLIHTFNHVVFSDIPWIVTFESTVPRTNFTVDRPWEKNREIQINGKSQEIDEITKKEFELLGSNYCKAIIALSESAYRIQANMLENIASDYYNVLMKKTIIIHPPQEVLCSEDDVKNRFINLSDNKKYPYSKKNDKGLKFIFVGADAFRKGIQQVIDCLSVFEEKSNFHLTIISTMNYGDYASKATKEDQEHYIKIMKDRPWITWYYSLDNKSVIEMMKENHIGLLPTLADTYGYSVLEMQACGLPVITTDIRALSEINNENIGWICHLTKDNIGGEAIFTNEEERAKRKEELSNELRRVFEDVFQSDPEEIRRKGLMSRQRIIDKHDLKKYGDKLMEIYKIV